METSKGRVPYWDNLKAFLILLVVLAHVTLSAPNKGTLLLGVTYYIYIFHMPAFVFVSGFFSKNYMKRIQTTGKVPINKLFGYICLYVILTMLIRAVACIFKGASLTNIDFLNMDGAPWYMLAMVIWLVVLPIFAQIGKKKAIILSLFIAIIIPALGELTTLFTLGRVINFLPFFIIGYYFESKWIDVIKGKKVFVFLAMLVLLLLAVFVFNNINLIRKYSEYLWQARGYSSYPTSKLFCIIGSIGYYSMVSIIILAIMVLCPKRDSFVSLIGSNTLGVYIGHRIFRDVVVNLGLYQYFNKNEITSFLFCLIISIIMTVAFSGKRFNQLCNLPFKIIK